MRADEAGAAGDEHAHRGAKASRAISERVAHANAVDRAPCGRLGGVLGAAARRRPRVGAATTISSAGEGRQRVPDRKCRRPPRPRAPRPSRREATSAAARLLRARVNAFSSLASQSSTPWRTAGTTTFQLVDVVAEHGAKPRRRRASTVVTTSTLRPMRAERARSRPARSERVRSSSPRGTRAARRASAAAAARRAARCAAPSTRAAAPAAPARPSRSGARGSRCRPPRRSPPRSRPRCSRPRRRRARRRTGARRAPRVAAARWPT